jgi:L-ectoine synthase
MIVRTKADLARTSQSASGEGWSSTLFLVTKDGVGFSLNDTEIAPGTEITLQYANHIEACHCISSTGHVTATKTGIRHTIVPGTMYCLDQHDRHTLRADDNEPLRLICVFTPALAGDETHSADGGYDV